MVHSSAFQAVKNGLVKPCARHDSNVRPLPPQGSALSPELRARDGQSTSGSLPLSTVGRPQISTSPRTQVIVPPPTQI